MIKTRQVEGHWSVFIETMMNTLKFCQTLVIIFCAYFNDIQAKSNIDQVFVLLRHAARPPIEVNNLNASDFVPLTNEGKYQSFTLGKWLRNHYPDLLNRKYLFNEIYARSSDVDRSIMTAQTLLAGLYYPIDSTDIWAEKEDLQWTPIPVHTVPMHLDPMLYAQRDIYCKKMQKSIKHTVDKLRKKYPEFFDYFENITKSQVDNSNKLNNILMEYFETNMPPMLTQETAHQLIQDGLDLYFKNPTWNRIDTGSFLWDLQQNINNGGQNMRIYTTHDNIIWGMLFGMGVERPENVEFLSTLIFEIHVKNSTSEEELPKKYIKIMLINGPSAPVEVKHIPNCDELCPLEKFEAFIQPLVVKDWHKECNED